jgi:hypothetical protein
VLVNSANLGVVRSQKSALASVFEPYVDFAAADDTVIPGFFERAIRLLETHYHAGLFCGETILVNADTGRNMGARPLIRPRHTEGFIDSEATRRLLKRSDNWIVTGSAVFRRDAIISAGGLQEELGSFADGYLARKIALTHGFIFSPNLVSTWRISRAGASRSVALDLQKADTILQTVPRRIAVDPVFPDWYVNLFRRRWRFAVSRLALESDPVDRPLLLSFGAASSFDRAVLELTWATLAPRLARVATLALLWLRFRPMSLFSLLTTAVYRHRER